MRLPILLTLLILIATLAFRVSPAQGQHFSRVERERAEAMLQSLAHDVRNYYYDPKLHGVDWDAKVKEAKERIATADSLNSAILQIAALPEVLDDSHTKFFPPRDPIPQEYGWRFQMVGAHCLITEVQPKSDAEARGLQVGDEVLAINGFALTRESVPKLEYVLNALIPQSSLELDLRSPSGTAKRAIVNAKRRQSSVIMDYGDMTGRDRWKAQLEGEDELRLARPRIKELGDGLMILKLPAFVPTDVSIAGIIERARKHSALIVDLRNNSGGVETTLQTLIGEIFDKDVRIANRVTRDGTRQLTAKASQKAFSGKLIVIVDSRSASAAELFARVVQIEKRGVVIGDRTAGSVMEAKLYMHETGISPVYRYVNSISEADLIMSDGKSIERTGITPDEIVLPSATDLAAHRDPVLARAAEIVGVALSADDAGTFFPYEWPRP